MPLLALAAGTLAVLVVAWLVWSTVVAFVGGDIPLTGFHLTGHDGLRGLAWLLTADPTALGVLATVLAAALVARAGVPAGSAARPAAPGRLAAGRQLLRTAALTSHVSGGVRIMLVAAFTVVSCLAAMCWLLWTTVIAVTGGTVPLTSWQLHGGLATGAVRGLVMVFIVVPVSLYVLLLAYSLAVAASAQSVMAHGLDQAAARGQDVRTARSWLRIIRWAAFAVGVGAALAWAYTS